MHMMEREKECETERNGLLGGVKGKGMCRLAFYLHLCTVVDFVKYSLIPGIAVLNVYYKYTMNSTHYTLYTFFITHNAKLSIQNM